MGPFTMTRHTGETAYRLDLSFCVVLWGVHSVFHVLLLRDWQDIGVHTDMPLTEIDGEAEYEVLGIKGHRECNSKL